MMASVSEYGALEIHMPRIDSHEALRLARWILDTFGEAP